MRRGFYAFFCETGSGYNLIEQTFEENEKCDLQELPYLQILDPYYTIQKNSTYREFIRIGLIRLGEHGLEDRQQTRIYTNKPKCSTRGGKFISVGIIDVQPALLLLCWGFGIAFTIFASEMTLRKLNLKPLLRYTGIFRGNTIDRVANDGE